LHEDIALIIIAILIHYGIEFGKDMGDYSCPSYCEVKHEHIKEDGSDEFKKHK
tara:strand:- start:584 stop:742 length:159 start_codon:yes stop_codon:yes gene_type:complete